MEGHYNKPRRKLSSLAAAQTIVSALKALRRIKRAMERRQAKDLEKSAVRLACNKH